MLIYINQQLYYVITEVTDMYTIFTIILLLYVITYKHAEQYSLWFPTGNKLSYEAIAI